MHHTNQPASAVQASSLASLPSKPRSVLADRSGRFLAHHAQPTNTSSISATDDKSSDLASCRRALGDESERWTDEELDRAVRQLRAYARALFRSPLTTHTGDAHAPSHRTPDDYLDESRHLETYAGRDLPGDSPGQARPRL